MCFEHFAVGRLKALVGRYDQSKLVAQKPSSTQPILVSISIMGGSWIWCCIPASDSQPIFKMLATISHNSSVYFLSKTESW